MFDPRIGRWLSEDPIGFQAADPNLYRYVSNSPIGSTDPTGLVGPPPASWLMTIKVTKQGTPISLAKFGNGKVAVKDGPAGIISVDKDVSLQWKAPWEAKFGPESGGWIRIRYKPTNSVPVQDMDFVQFMWFELKETKGGKSTNCGIPGLGGIPANLINTNAGQAFITTDVKRPQWVVDRMEGSTSISFLKSYRFGEQDKDLVLYDIPGPGQIASYAKSAAALAKTNAGVTQWTAIIHFDTYLVYKKKPIYKLSWTASSSIAAQAGAYPSNTEYEVVDAKPVNSLDSAQIDLLKKPRYKGQNDITLP